MAKKSLGKVKHYRRGKAVTGRQLRRMLGWLLGAAALFALGWFIGPPILNFGTRTWYSLKNGQTAQSGPQSGPAEVLPTPEPTPEPTQEPTPAPSIEAGNWAFLSFSAVSTPEKAAETAQQLAAQGVRYAVVPLKDAQGYIYYDSRVEKAAQSIAATTLDAAGAAEALRAAGIEPVGGVTVFQDPVAPYTDRTMGVYYQDTDYFWLDAARDAGGKPWLSPYSETAVNFITSLLDEVQALGYRQLLLGGINYPPTATDRANFHNETGEEPPARLAALIGQWQQNAEARGGAVWVEYPLSAARPGQALLGGGSLGQLGVKNMVLTLPAEQEPEEREALLADARGAAREGGAAHLVLRTGGEAAFDEAFG